MQEEMVMDLTLVNNEKEWLALRDKLVPKEISPTMAGPETYPCYVRISNDGTRAIFSYADDLEEVWQRVNYLRKQIKIAKNRKLASESSNPFRTAALT